MDTGLGGYPSKQYGDKIANRKIWLSLISLIKKKLGGEKEKK